MNLRPCEENKITFKTEFGYDPALKDIPSEERTDPERKAELELEFDLDPRNHGKMLSFLDIYAWITDNGIKTFPYYKDTNTHDYLLSTSRHEPSIFKGNVHTLFHGVRSHTDDEFLEIEMKKMEKWLKKRSYDTDDVDMIKREYEKKTKNECLGYDINFDRDYMKDTYNNWKLFNRNKKKENIDSSDETKDEFNKVIISLIYHPSIGKQQLLKMINKHYSIITNDTILSKIFPNKAKDCFEIRYRGDVSIARKVAPPTNLNKNSNNKPNNDTPGMKQCSAHKCYACEKRFNLISSDTEWICPTTQQRYKIRPYSCNHRFVIYVVYCIKCYKYYIGSSLSQLRKRLGQHRCNVEDLANGTYESENDSAANVYHHFNGDCTGDKDIPLLDKNGKEVKDKHGNSISKHKSLCNMKCFIIDTVNPKTIYKFLIGTISYKRVLHELYKLEMKYQGETLAFIHGLNTYVDWNTTSGLRRGDGSNVRKDLNISDNDYDNIYGLDQFLTRAEFEQLIHDRFG